MKNVAEAVWYYLQDGIALVGEFGCILVGLVGSLFGGSALWEEHGWISVPVALVWLVVWIAAASAIDDATS